MRSNEQIVTGGVERPASTPSQCKTGEDANRMCNAA